MFGTSLYKNPSPSRWESLTGALKVISEGPGLLHRNNNIDSGIFLRGMEKSGGVCGRAVNTSNTRSGCLGFQALPIALFP